jgi:hypothetical protein
MELSLPKKGKSKHNSAWYGKFLHMKIQAWEWVNIFDVSWYQWEVNGSGR